MSMKKKLGSKLTEGVRQVKAQREQAPAAAPAKTTPVAKPAAKPVSPAAKPVAPRAATQTATNLNKLHPQRVWPD